MAIIRDIDYSRFLSAEIVALILLLGLIMSPAQATTTVTFPAGAYIIDMSGFPYTQANGLKPYGLVYDLVINKQIPVAWAISPTKIKDGIDFTVTGSGPWAKSYRGGSFIISKDYASLAAPSIATWTAKGVKVYGPTDVSFSAPIYDNITSFPNAVCDLQNGAIIISAFYTPSEVPASSYRLGSPQDLGLCDDIYAMPHADPHQWTAIQKTTFSNFINNRGCLWAACHAVSSMEADAPTYFGQYYLSQTGLIPWGSHAGPVLPYSYNASSANHPIMQFIGKVDNSLQSGSEKVYIPDTTPAANNWRTSTTVAVWSPNQPNVFPSRPLVKAAIVAYGYAFGDVNKGFITYEASHSISTGNTSENVDAARIYGNFLLYSGILRRPQITATIPTTFLSGETKAVSASITNGAPPYTYAWSSTCGGSFANPTAASTTFTAPTVTAPTSCIIRLMVKDACNRRNFVAQAITIFPKIMTLTKTDFKTVTQPGDILNYTINYSNTGSVPATNVTIVDVLPKEVTYISAYPAPLSVAPGGGGTTIITWNIGTVPGPSGIKKVLLNASVKDTVSVGDSVIDNVNLSYWAFNFGPVVITALDKDDIVPVTKMVDKTLTTAGQYLNYTICPAYDSTKLLTSARVEDVLPANTITPTNINASGVYSGGNNTIRWNLGSNVKGTTGKVSVSNEIKGYLRNAAVNDTYVKENSPNNNYGTTTLLETDNKGGDRSNILLYFNLPTLPSGAVMSKAELDVFVTNARGSTNVNIYRLTRSWCLRANGVCNNCTLPAYQLIVEGLQDNANTGNTYGATWTNYNYRQNAPALACGWTTLGGDYDSTKIFGNFLSTSTGLKTTNITNLVRGWYNGTYLLQGILLKQATIDDEIRIGSRGSTATQQPYLNVSYTIPATPGTNVSIWAHPLLTCEGGKIKINMTVNATQSILVTPPATFTVTGTNGATATYFSGPMPASATIPANINYNFTYVYTINPGANPGSVTFTGKPTSASATFVNGVSNSVLVTPKLTYRVVINPSTPNSVNTITNDAKFLDSSVIPLGVLSPIVTTNLFWPASIQTTKIANVSIGSLSTMINFTMSVKNTNLATLDPVVVVDTLPAGIEYITSFNGSANGNVITWNNIGPLAPNQNKSIWFVGHLDGNAYGFLTNVVNASGTTIDGRKVWSNASKAVQSLTVGLDVTKSTNASVGSPSNFTAFYLNVTNTGQATLNPVYVQDFLPEGLEYKSSNATSLDLPNNTLTWSNIGPMTGGQKKTLTVIAHIDGSYFGDLYNTVVVTGKPPSGGNLTVVNSTIVEALEPKINVTKSVTPLQGSPSTDVNFTINVTNVGEVNFTSTKVVDTLPFGLNYVSSYPAGGVAVGNVVTWNSIGALNVGQYRLVYVKAHINGSKLGWLKNLVDATGTTNTGWKVTDQNNTSVLALRPALSSVKSANLSSGAPSTMINFTIQVSNSGNVTLNPVKVVDTLPAGLNYISSGNGSAAGSIVTWTNIGPLSPGQTKQLWMVSHINGLVYGPLNNTVDVTGTPPTGNNVTNQSYKIITALRASITLNKNSNLSLGAPSSKVNFTLVVNNTGEVTLDPVKVVDTLPAGLDFVSSGNGSDAGSVVTWTNIGPLLPGQIKQLWLVAHINGAVYGDLNNTATVTGTPPTGNRVTANASRIVAAKRASIEVNKTNNVSSAPVGSYVNFILKVTNTGEVTLSPVKVVDTMDFGLSYISSNGTAVGNVVTWSNIGPMTSGQIKYLYLVAQLNGSAVGPLHNFVDVTGTPPAGNNVTNTSHSEVVAIAAGGNISVMKDALPAQGVYNQHITFTIEVANSGTDDLDPVKVVDILPSGLTYLSDDRGGVNVSKTITWTNVGPLASGASTFIHLVVFVDGDEFGYLTNHVNATGKTEFGQTVTHNATAVVEALYNPGFVITKTTLNETVEPGENVSFIIKATNTGDVPLSTVRVVDVLPPGLVYVSDNSTPPGVVSGNMITWSNVGPLAVGASKFIELIAKVVL